MCSRLAMVMKFYPTILWELGKKCLYRDKHTWLTLYLLNICSHINTMKANFSFFVVAAGKINLVSNLDFLVLFFFFWMLIRAHWGQIGTKQYKDCSTTKKEKKSSASFFATSEILVPKISFCYCVTKLGKPLFYFRPAFFLLVSSGMLWLIPGKKNHLGPNHFTSGVSPLKCKCCHLHTLCTQWVRRHSEIAFW